MTNIDHHKERALQAQLTNTGQPVQMLPKEENAYAPNSHEPCNIMPHISMMHYAMLKTQHKVRTKNAQLWVVYQMWGGNNAGREKLRTCLDVNLAL